MPKRKGIFPKIKIIVYGSSHAMPHHHLPHHLQENFQNHSRFLEPDVYAESGAKIDPEFVEIVKEEITNQAQNPTAIVLIMGSNNTRNGDQSPHEVLPLFEEIVHHGSHYPKCHVVLVSIIPSPSTDHYSAGPFIETSNLLKELSKKEEYLHRVSFFNIADKLLEEKNNFARDLLHLSYEGARIFAEGLKNHLEQRRQVCFSSNPSKIKKK